jgi:hypothetical protein
MHGPTQMGVAGSEDAMVSTWVLDMGLRLHTFVGHTRQVTMVCFERDLTDSIHPRLTCGSPRTFRMDFRRDSIPKLVAFSCSRLGPSIRKLIRRDRSITNVTKFCDNFPRSDQNRRNNTPRKDYWSLVEASHTQRAAGQAATTRRLISIAQRAGIDVGAQRAGIDIGARRAGRR